LRSPRWAASAVSQARIRQTNGHHALNSRGPGEWSNTHSQLREKTQDMPKTTPVELLEKPAHCRRCGKDKRIIRTEKESSKDDARGTRAREMFDRHRTKARVTSSGAREDRNSTCARHTENTKVERRSIALGTCGKYEPSKIRRARE